jgi:aminopeptidase N
MIISSKRDGRPTGILYPPGMNRPLALLLSLAVCVPPAAARPFDEERAALAAANKWDTEKPKYRRDREADIERVSLELEPDFQTLSFKGKVTHAFKVLAPELGELTLDARGLDILKAADGGGKALDFDHTGDKLKVRLAKALKAGERGAVRIEYSGAYHQGMDGAFLFKPDPRYPGQDELMYTQGQPETNSQWAPLYDYPNERASSEIVIIAPDGLTAVSNGKLASKEPGARPGTTRWRWVQERPHVSYLMAVYVGRYGRVDDSAKLGERAVPVSYYVPKGLEEDAKATFAKTPAMLTFFSEWLDSPYPWDRYDQIVNYRYGGGMENTAATNIGERNLRDRRAMLAEDTDGLIAHELAHQWFGDLVTCKDWSHIWINEASASYFQALWAQKDKGEDEYLWDLRGKGRRYFGEAGAYLRPIVSERYKHPWDVFDNHTYQKGSYVLHMLRRELGDARFQAGWRRFLRDNKDTVADTEDLRRAFEETTGRSFAEFFAQWVHGKGHPDLKLALAYDAKEKKLSLTANQRQVKKGQPAFKLKLPLQLAGGKTVVAELSEEDQTVSWDVSSRPKWVSVDPGLAVLAELELEWPEDMLFAELASGPTGVGRARAAETLAKKGSSKVVSALGDCLKKDPFWGTASTCAEALARVGGRDAVAALAAGASRKEARVRRAVAGALGGFTRKPEALEPLKTLAIGALRLPESRGLLEPRLNDESWHDAVAAGALDGLGRLRDQSLLPLFEQWMGPGRSIYARDAALVAYARAADTREGASDPLTLILETETDHYVTGAAMNALRVLGDPRAIPALSRVMARMPEGAAARVPDSISSIREGKKGRLEELSSQIDEFSKKLEKLEKRLDDAEKKKKG